MSGITAELHIHSCLSPCADDDMTPANIAGMLTVCEFGMGALTDHNSSKNCPAFFKACEMYGIVPVAGMELTTAEDIHVVCLFPTLDRAMAFDAEVSARRMHIKNKPEVFGNQFLMDEEDTVLGTEEDLLIPATAITLEEAVPLVKSFDGAAYPAHIDRESNGILGVLGFLPDVPVFTAAELADADKLTEFSLRSPYDRMHLLTASDAHRLESIGTSPHVLHEDIRDAVALVRWLNSERGV